MNTSLEEMQRLSQANVDSAMRLFGDFGKSWQAIAAEFSDYTRRSMEEGTATMEKLMAAKSVEQAMEIQTSYARRAYEAYLQEMNKLGGMYASLAKEAYKPMDKLMHR